MSFWYHFAIVFEALFILTTIDAGSPEFARFMIQDLIGHFVPAFKRPGAWNAKFTATRLAVMGWGWFLYQGVIDTTREASIRFGHCLASPIKCWRRSR